MIDIDTDIICEIGTANTGLHLLGLAKWSFYALDVFFCLLIKNISCFGDLEAEQFQRNHHVEL